MKFTKFLNKLTGKEKEEEKLRRRINKIMSTRLSYDYIISLTREVRGVDGQYMYPQVEFFVCELKREHLPVGGRFKVAKITGDYFGETFDLVATQRLEPGRNSYSRPTCSAKLEVVVGGQVWRGSSAVAPSIPYNCITVRDLNAYANAQNKQYKTGYEEWDAQRKQNQNIELR